MAADVIDECDNLNDVLIGKIAYLVIASASQPA